MSSLTRAEETTLALVAGGKLSPEATHVNMLVTLGYAETDGRIVTLTPKGRKFLDDRGT